MAERLQKLIAQAGLASRRQAEAWIAEGRVKLNGQLAKLGDKADLTVDRVCVDEQNLRLAETKVTLLLNKPRGYISTLKDPQGRKRVTDLVADVPQRVFPVGRLDFNTEGLLLLSNDGELAQKLSHPRQHVAKTYLVKVRGQLSSKAVEQIQQGVLLEDGVTLPAEVANIKAGKATSWFELTLYEGRNRQIRRMCEVLGLPVVRLKRLKLAFLDLAEVPVGRFRFLSAQEVGRLKKLP